MSGLLCLKQFSQTLETRNLNPTISKDLYYIRFEAFMVTSCTEVSWMISHGGIQ